MKITTRGRYGLRAMLGLARHYDKGPVLMGALAEQERISRKYLHAVLAALKSAGLVCSIRGAGGGFELARPPWEIRLDDVLRAAEGPLSLVDCVAMASRCDRASGCTARRVWQTLSLRVEQVLHSVSLQDLLAMELPGFDSSLGPEELAADLLSAQPLQERPRKRGRRLDEQQV